MCSVMALLEHEQDRGSMNRFAQQICIPWHMEQDNTAGVQA